MFLSNERNVNQETHLASHVFAIAKNEEYFISQSLFQFSGIKMQLDPLSWEIS